MKLPSLKYYSKIYQRFGYSAVLFLIRSKLKKNKIGNLRIKQTRYPISLSNFKFDVTTLFQIFFAEEYGVKLKGNPKYIIDCGANIGLSALYFANKFPSAKIIAIEPDDNNFKFLELNTKYYPNVICIKKAVWSHNEKLAVIDPGKGNWGLQTKTAVAGQTETIDGITIDEILVANHIDEIDLLKIDIEGAEKELFTSGYENWLSKTKVMAIELHDFFDPTISPLFYKAIEPYRFRQYQLGENLIFEREDI